MGVWPEKVSMAVIGALKYQKIYAQIFPDFTSRICNVRQCLP